MWYCGSVSQVRFDPLSIPEAPCAVTNRLTAVVNPFIVLGRALSSQRTFIFGVGLGDTTDAHYVSEICTGIH